MGVGLGSVEMPSAPAAPVAPAAAELPPTPAAPAIETLNQDGIIKNLEDKVEGMQKAEEAEIKINADENPQEKTTNENTKLEGKPSAEEPSIIPGTEVQPEKDLQSDPLYQKSLGEVTNNAISKGEPLDGKKLQEEALAKYQEEKAKEPTKDKAEQSLTEKSLDDVVKTIDTLLKNNRENLESAMITVSAADLAILLKAVAEAKQQEPKKKESILALALKLLGIIVISGATEVGKEVNPPTSKG